MEIAIKDNYTCFNYRCTMTQEELNKTIEKHQLVVIAATYNVLFTNDIVLGLVKEASEKIKKSCFYKHETKMYLKRVEKAVNEYERFSMKIIGPRSEFFANANTTFAEELQTDINRLTYSIKRQFDKMKIPNAYMLAKAETARTICDFACVQLDQRVDELKHLDRNFSNVNIDYLRQTAICKNLNNMMLTFNIPASVNLNTEECRNMLNNVTKKLADCEIIAKAISA